MQKKKIKAEEQTDLEKNNDKLDEDVSRGVLHVKDLKVQIEEA